MFIVLFGVSFLFLFLLVNLPNSFWDGFGKWIQRRIFLPRYSTGPIIFCNSSELCFKYKNGRMMIQPAYLKSHIVLSSVTNVSNMLNIHEISQLQSYDIGTFQRRILRLIINPYKQLIDVIETCYSNLFSSFFVIGIEYHSEALLTPDQILIIQRKIKNKTRQSKPIKLYYSGNELVLNQLREQIDKNIVTLSNCEAFTLSSFIITNYIVKQTIIDLTLLSRANSIILLSNSEYSNLISIITESKYEIMSFND